MNKIKAGHKKILIVDDDADFLKATSMVLQSSGYEAYSADSGEEALKCIAKSHPALILLDILMPGMDGHQLASKIRQQEKTKEIPIIMITGKKDHATISKSFKFNISGYVVKPFENSQLLDKIKKAFES
ncbi:MAG: response regulator [Candidatus Saganbacteria bacterium]|nr:response regulator [Candidatus Saganbacteria bacterium]